MVYIEDSYGSKIINLKKVVYMDIYEESALDETMYICVKVYFDANNVKYTNLEFINDKEGNELLVEAIKKLTKNNVTDEELERL